LIYNDDSQKTPSGAEIREIGARRRKEKAHRRAQRQSLSRHCPVQRRDLRRALQDVPLYVLLLLFIALRPTGFFGVRSE